MAGALAGVFIYLIAKELFPKRVARIASLFAFFWPSFIMWSTQHLKEPMITMLFCIIIWSVLYMFRRPYPGFLLLTFMSAWALFEISVPFFIITFGMMFFAALFLFMDYLFRNKFINILILVLVSIAAFFLLKDRIFGWMFESGFHDVKSYGSIFKYLNFSRNVRAVGRLQFLKSVDISSFGGAVTFVPFGLLFALFAPFPWQIGSLSQIIAVPETIFFYMMFPFTLKGIIFGYKKRLNQSMMLLSIIIGMLAFLALVDANSGTLFRHRCMAFHLLFIFTAVGISLERQDVLQLK